MPGDGAIDAILVVLQGGADVALRVAALGWAGRCIVLDPAELVGEVRLPPDTRRARDPAAAIAAVEAPWVWLMTDQEHVSPALQSAIRAVTQSSPLVNGAVVRIEHRGVSAHLGARARTLRLARRSGLTLRIDRRLDVYLQPGGPPRTTFAGVLERRTPAAVAEATAALEAESRAMAMLLDAAGHQPTVRRAFASMCAAAWNLRTARRLDGRRVDQAIATVVGGYRSVLCYARLWERAYAAGAVT